MYTIRQASARAGIPVATMRAWERRYAIVQPARTAAAYRLYSDLDIEALRAMRRLVESGWSPSVAAAALLARDASALEAASGPAGQEPSEPASPEGPGLASAGPARRVTDADGVELPGADAATLIERFTVAAAGLDEDALASVLDEMAARGSFERVAEDLLLPALRGLGDAWATGRVSIAAEHAASHAVLRRLAAAFEAAGRPADGQAAVVIALVPGARHELGAFTFAIAARRAGLPVAWLGADLPAGDWVTATRSARAAVIGVPTDADIGAARSVVRELRRANPDLLVAVGGAAAPAIRGVLHLPDGELVSAVRALSAAIDRGSGRLTRA